MKNAKMSKKKQILCVCSILIAVAICVGVTNKCVSGGKNKKADSPGTQMSVSSAGDISEVTSPMASLSETASPTLTPTMSPTGSPVDLSMFAIVPQFAYAAPFDSEGYAVVCGVDRDPIVYDGVEQPENVGVINEKGEYVLPPEYAGLGIFYNYDYGYSYSYNMYGSENQAQWIEKGGQYCLVNKNYELLYVPDVEEVGYFNADGLSTVKSNGKWGVINGNGKMVIEPVYDEIREYGFGKIAYGVSVGGLWGVINKTGDMVIAPQYIDIAYSADENGNIGVDVDGKWGMINENGEMIVEPLYDSIYFQTDGLAQITLLDESGAQKCGIVNAKGEVIIEPIYDWINILGVYEDGTAVESSFLGFVMGNYGNSDEYYRGLSGLISITGEVIIEPQFDWIDYFTANHLARVQKDGKYGFINEDGKIVIDCQYDYATSFDENGLAQVAEYGICDKWGILNSQGEMVLDLKYDAVGDFASNGLAAVMLGEKSGYINTSGEFVIEPQFDWAKKFEENGLAEVKIDGNIGYINETGECVIAPQFQTDMGDWSAFGTIFIMQNGKWGLINTEGEFLIQPRFDNMSISGEYDYETGKFAYYEYATVREDGKYGLASLDGTILLEPISENGIGSISPNGLIPVEVNGIWGYIQIAT